MGFIYGIHVVKLMEEVVNLAIHNYKEFIIEAKT